MTVTARCSPGTAYFEGVYYPTEPGRIDIFRAARNPNVMRWVVGGWPGDVTVSPTYLSSYLITVRDGCGKIGYTQIAGHPDVVCSVAETMLAGAARAAGIEVKR